MNNKREVTVVFTPTAWTKMWLLVDRFDSEVGWNTLCRRDGDKYVVEDILVHKQRVTGGTFRTDPAEYDEWLGEFDDDTLLRIQGHGHSHYYAHVSPSGLDREMQADIVSQLSGDMFYIFMIVNRQRCIWLKVVDTLNDVVAQGLDVTYSIGDDTFNAASFLRQARELVSYQVYKVEKSKIYLKEEPNGSGEIV